MTSSKPPTELLKVVVVGDCGVGKSSIINALAGNQFSEDYTHTVAVDYNCCPLFPENVLLKLNIWDTSGELTFPALTQEHYQRADGFVFVYDITRKESLKGLKFWLNEVNNYARCRSLPKLIVGNKYDLREDRVVSESDAKEFGIPEGMRHFEVSAYSNRNIQAAFEILATEMKRHKELGGIVPMGSKTSPNKNRNNNRDTFSRMDLTKFPNLGVGIPDYIRQIKILVIGATRVGKTSLVNRFISNDFNPEYKSTIRIDFNQKTIEIDKRSMKVHVLDCSGDEEFEDTRRSYYKGANAYMIVYDLTNRQSFRYADRILQELDSFKLSNIPRILVGNKCDLEVKRAVSTETAKMVAELKNTPAIETSCKMGVQVDATFARLIVDVLRKPTLWRNALSS